MFSGYVDASVLPGFLVAVTLILVAPGPDMTYMVTAGLVGGRRAATAAALGITVGVAMYVLAVAGGLGSALAGHTTLLVSVQVLGAAYLAKLSWDSFHEAGPVQDLVVGQSPSVRWFRRGLLVNLTNPKIALFLMAFLPLFLGDAESPALQFVMLGAVLQLAGLAADLAVGWTAGTVRRRVLERPSAVRVLAVASGLVLGALALGTVVDAALRLR